MNGAQESIEVHIDYQMTWIDEHLTWHPSDFADPIMSLVVPQSDIWQPDITLYDLLESIPLIPEEKLKARVDFDGRVTVYNPQIMTIWCKMKIDLFPFDSQKCRMAFGPWVYQQNEVAIEESNTFVPLSQCPISGCPAEWRGPLLWPVVAMRLWAIVDATGEHRPACREGLSPVYAQLAATNSPTHRGMSTLVG
uniref:Neurotransmitter-gated ion-channel ligand-binding domain-containing protein n=1 Tax=Plectus sambesii TaxID=2011161 RepID=A0A914VAL2_9BILA